MISKQSLLAFNVLHELLTLLLLCSMWAELGDGDWIPNGHGQYFGSTGIYPECG
jgi:hypothetical protein